MPVNKLYNFEDKNIDRQFVEIVKFINNPQPNDLPVFADNAAAVAGGLVKTKFYRTSTGVVMQVY